MTDAQQAILVRYANQFYTADMAMFAARGAAIQAKDPKTAHQVEQAFHTSAAAMIENLKKDLGPSVWATLLANMHNTIHPVFTNISDPKFTKGGN